MTSRVSRKDKTVIAQEWDSIALKRHRQIEDGVDRSFHDVLAPAILDSLGGSENLNVLDIGCGSGTLSSMIADRVKNVTAIDSSAESIKLAERECSKPNLEFIWSSAEEYSLASRQAFDAAVANMVLMDVAVLADVLRAAACLTKIGAKFYATITHPYFWPVYRGYSNADWFDYLEEIHIEAPFRIKAEELAIMTTHVHRPLQDYLSGLYEAGFRDVTIRELRGPAEDASDYPRFMLLGASKG